MQLIIISLALALLVFAKQLKAQVNTGLFSGQDKTAKGDSSKPEISLYADQDWNKIDISFLSSYYEQDGNMSAVTGGLGTEHLTDFTQKLIVTIPISSRLAFNLDGGYDYYTSASSDNVDPIRSDDSAEDTRVHGNIGITYKLDQQQTIGLRVGGSGEYDYGSASGGVTYIRTSKDENTVFSGQFQAFVDQWKIIYPIELRDRGQLLPNNNRQSFNLALGVNQVIDKKTQVGLQLEGIYMNGLLSTPFHRVYFQDQAGSDIERLPSSRLKIPVGVRLNRYISERLVARMYYRFYWDNWGMTAHTASIELPIKLSRFLYIAPSYRFHTQTAAKYYKPYGQHLSTDQFRTSDPDLAALNSHAVGIGISYQPANGIFNLKMPGRKERHITLKSADLRYSHYLKNQGFRADIISFGLGFSIH